MTREQNSAENLRTNNPVIRFTAWFLSDRMQQFQDGINNSYDDFVLNRNHLNPPFINYLALANILEHEFNLGFTRRNLGPMLGPLLDASLNAIQNDNPTLFKTGLPITALVVLRTTRIPSAQYFSHFNLLNLENDADNRFQYESNLQSIFSFQDWDAYKLAIANLFQ